MSKFSTELVRLREEIYKIDTRHLPMLLSAINPTTMYSSLHVIECGRQCLARLHANPPEAFELEDAVLELRVKQLQVLDIRVLAVYFEIQISKNTWLLSTLGGSNDLREEFESRNRALQTCKAFFSQLATSWESR